MKKVSIIGAGQLGSRHLQGLKTAQTEMEIWVIDASEESLGIAKERYDAVESKANKIVHYDNHIDALPQTLDLVIVATGSKPRASIIKSLLSQCRVNYLVLEKFLFTRLQDFDDIASLLKEKGVKSWVNCPRRMWPAYEEIKKRINPEEPVYLEYCDQNWGMCCNTVHNIDIWMYLAGDCQFNVDLSGVEPHIVESKRKGYIELLGNETFDSANGDKMSVYSLLEYEGDTTVKIQNAGKLYVVDEVKGSWFCEGEEHATKTPYQSALTGVLADEILSTGECRLSSYSISSQYHKPYLQAVMQFVNKIQGSNTDSCPIT